MSINRRLLEDGSLRLVSDGAYRLLEDSTPDYVTANNGRLISQWRRERRKQQMGAYSTE